MPLVSVLLPVYNGEKYLREAIDSILQQTFPDFELLLLNDGSSDHSEHIILSYTDPRIRYIKNEQNRGLIYTLNRGIDLAKGEFIARMDADDISLPGRFHCQIRFLKKHPEVGFCGTWAYRIDAAGKTTGKMRKPVDGEILQICSLFTSPYIHPTVMIRSELLKVNKYDPNFKHAEDYELWVRLQQSTLGANLPVYLLKYRWYEGNISVVEHDKQANMRKKIIMKEMKRWGINMNDKDYLVHISTFLPHISVSMNDLRQWFIRLKDFNTHRHVFVFPKFNAFLLSRWIIFCIQTHQYLKVFCFIYPSFLTLKYLFVILAQKK